MHVNARSLCAALALLCCAAGCKDKESAPPATGAAPETAAAAPGPATPAAQPAADKEADHAAAAKNPAAAMAQAMGALNAMAQAAGGNQQLGPIVNWRELVAFAPDAIGAFKADGEARGSTTTIGAMHATEVSRRYRAGERSLHLKIVDTSMVPMLRAGFAMASMVNEDSSSGLKQGTKVKGQPALLEWRAQGKHGSLSLLAGGRYVATLNLDPCEKPQEVVTLAESALKIEALAQLKPAAK